MANQILSFMESMQARKSTKTDGISVRIDLNKFKADLEANADKVYKGTKSEYVTLYLGPRKTVSRYGATHYVSILPLASKPVKASKK